jgi:hypothetical protein
MTPGTTNRTEATDRELLAALADLWGATPSNPAPFDRS